MPADTVTAFSCSECDETFQFNKHQRRNHRRRCTDLSVKVTYTRRLNKGGYKPKPTIYREDDGNFYCLYCDKFYDDSECVRTHAGKCKDRTAVTTAAPAAPALPIPTPPTSAVEPSLSPPAPPPSSPVIEQPSNSRPGSTPSTSPVESLASPSDPPAPLFTQPPTPTLVAAPLPVTPAPSFPPPLSSFATGQSFAQPAAPAFSATSGSSFPPPSFSFPPPQPSFSASQSYFPSSQSFFPPTPSLPPPAYPSLPWFTQPASAATPPPVFSTPPTSSSSSVLLPASSPPTFVPGPLGNSTGLTGSVPMPMAVQNVALPLLKALGTLAKTCPVCWLRDIPSQHHLFGCANADPPGLATSDDPIFQAFKNSIDCPDDFSLCYGCYINPKLNFALDNGRPSRFHGKGVGRKACRFTDAIVPVLYYVFEHPRLRRMLDRYGIPGRDFATISQNDFTDWLLTPAAPTGALPPPLLVLHTMIGAFGMPSAPLVTNNP